ncbi:Asp-tRNA(Asn)/Glu-tRNA(Gln) amidotransferase subunit GatC [Candidatus Bathyarchaeota archaeon]|nr:Asp-tRNA(Asn)/Glu-tRNA(Gln) amidotransferase subunit GatC [Candidatus Bathyarchaeota archaeon]MBS7629391.1 Asp-tRNA(Asn)/Glu-tRNA(Gln) amidotransferase subunit GatC [Candidatus Bathyarchaeota archaeon]
MAKEVITLEEVRRLAWLSKIKISKREERRYLNEMSEILEYFRMLDEIDTEGVEPTYHVIELVNVTREDAPQQTSPDSLLEIVPVMKGRYVKAPRIV